MKITKIKKIINEEIHKVLYEWDDDNFYDIWELRDEIFNETIREYLRKKGSGRKQAWKVVPFGRLKKIWEDWVKTGVIRDTKGFAEIEERMIRNILKLDVNTELAGHSTSIDTDTLENYSLTEDDLETEEFDDFMSDPSAGGHWRISDFGLNPLWKLLEKLKYAKTPEEKLPIIDQMLNVVHMRSDLAAWFVEGGSSALSQLSGYVEDKVEY